jgi:hypothetical protein
MRVFRHNNCAEFNVMFTAEDFTCIFVHPMNQIKFNLIYINSILLMRHPL